METLKVFINELPVPLQNNTPSTRTTALGNYPRNGDNLLAPIPEIVDFDDSFKPSSVTINSRNNDLDRLKSIGEDSLNSFVNNQYLGI